ncbi:hypothetical protein, partial [Tateyamaria sp. syn59]|uniref:hypothetical protein n=1 Tax=Tateyamaria sp. syn59 TaxID=2576942 RepID=UPI001CB8C198
MTEHTAAPVGLEEYVVKYSDGVGTGLGKVKTKCTTWDRFYERFERENILVDTECTYAQYLKLNDDETLEKKRAPGNWLAALFKEGRRKATHNLGRTMIVYDIDTVTPEQLDNIIHNAAINKYAWLMHTSRKHCPEKPRVRMIFPVQGRMDEVQFNAIARFLALQLADDPEEAIEIPDLVSFRYTQTMFKPSISKDQEYWLRRNDGEVLDRDEFLTECPNWDDFAQLPYQSEEKARAVQDPNRKMEDPREKFGLIGAWCRVYTVDDAIAEYLSDVYEPGDSATETRYTYVAGSGSNGAVAYDNGLFLHS